MLETDDQRSIIAACDKRRRHTIGDHPRYTRTAVESAVDPGATTVGPRAATVHPSATAIGPGRPMVGPGAAIGPSPAAIGPGAATVGPGPSAIGPRGTGSRTLSRIEQSSSEECAGYHHLRPPADAEEKIASGAILLFAIDRHRLRRLFLRRLFLPVFRCHRRSLRREMIGRCRS